MPIPVRESEFIEKYGELPRNEEKAWIRSELILQCNLNLEEVWTEYWRERRDEMDLLERLYEFWNIQRERIRKE